MGQRSQIYIKYNNGEEDKFIARYFQWNYGERMISRARYTIQWIEEHLDYMKYEESKLPQIIETNFDLVDILKSLDIVKEYNEYFSEGNRKEEIFNRQDNNDGQLYIDARGGIKYCFCEMGGKPMNGREYMKWDVDKDYAEEYLDEEERKALEDNLKALDGYTLMTEEELESFKNEEDGIKNTY